MTTPSMSYRVFTSCVYRRRRFIALVVAILIAGFTAAAAETVTNSPPRYLAALEALARGDHAAGIKAYYKYLLIDDPLLSLACRQADLAKAAAWVRGAGADKPNRALAALNRSLLARILLAWSEADQRLGALRQEHPKSVLLQFLQGEFWIQQDRGRDASPLLLELKNNPRGQRFAKLVDLLIARHGVNLEAEADRQTLMRTAMRHLDLLEYAAAEKCLRELIRRFPDDTEAPRALIDMLLEAGRNDAADETLTELRQRHGVSPLLPVQEARLHYTQRRFADAIPLLDAVMRDEPDNHYALSMLAESHFQAQNYASATACFAQLRAADPDNFGTLLRHLSCLEMQGLGVEAMRQLDTVLGKTPDNALLRFERARLADRLDFFADAIRMYHDIIDGGGPYRNVAESHLSALQTRLQLPTGATGATPPTGDTTATTGPSGSGNGPEGTGTGTATTADASVPPPTHPVVVPPPAKPETPVGGRISRPTTKPSAGELQRGQNELMNRLSKMYE